MLAIDQLVTVWWLLGDYLIDSYSPAPHSYYEQNPHELLKSVIDCLDNVANQLQQKGDLMRLKGIGISNERETTILWDRTTGDPLDNAICEMC